MARVGTLEWADKTEGRLTLRDRLVLLVCQGVPTQIEELAGRVLGLLDRARPTDMASPLALADSAEVQIPSGPITGAAEKLSRTVYEPWLLAHCYRTYVIGALLGRALPFDSEMLFAASMLHDIGLTQAFEQGSDPGLVPGYARKEAPCFAVRGAGVAQSLATNHGWPRANSDALAEAISLHANVRVARSRGAEARLLNAGSAFDVVRLRSRKLPHDSVRSIEGRWPRGDRFCDDLCAAWAREAKAHRECRAAFLSSWGSFERRIRKTCPPNAG
jgi:hypothetical protein